MRTEVMRTRGLLAILFLIIAMPPSMLLCDSYVFKNFNLEDGLSQSSIQSIVQDSQGYLWFSTADGLNRYDGYEFKIYRNIPLDNQSLSDNSLAASFVDRDGIIWFGTFLGILNRYDRRADSFSRVQLDSMVPARTANNFGSTELILNYSRRTEHTITSICEDNLGNLWIGTWGKGIIIYNKKSGRIYNLVHDSALASSLSCNSISQLVFDGKDGMWAATFGGGLCMIKTSSLAFGKDAKTFSGSASFITLKARNGRSTFMRDNYITSLLIDRHGAVWFGSYQAGLCCIKESFVPGFNSTSPLSYIALPGHTAPAAHNYMTLAIEEDKDGSIWAGTFGSGLLRVKPGRNDCQLLTNDIFNKNSLSSNDILSLHSDRTGIMWIGASFSAGLCKMTKSNLKFNFLTKGAESKDGLNDKIIWSIYQDNAGDLWLGTYTGGVNRFNRAQNRVQIYKNDKGNPNSISSNHVRAITADRFGSMWFGTFSGGLNRMNLKTGTFTRYLHDPEDPNSIASNQIQSLRIDSGDTLWICTFSGGLNYIPLAELYSGSKPRFRKINHDPSDSSTISSNRTYTMLIASDGYIWIGTYGGGVCRLDRRSGRAATYRNIPGNPNSLADNRVMALHEDEGGNIWVGTNGGGINCIEKKSDRVVRFNEEHGLLSQTVYSILEDEHDNFWLSTDNGIYKFEESTKSFIHYNYYDGLQSTEFNGGAYFKARNGEFFFGGVNGVNYFFPDSVKKNNHVPPVVIQNLKVFDKEIKGMPESLRLSYNENFITMEFAALDFSNPQGNRYAYILQGFDKNWHYTDSKYRVAHYTNLPHGRYTFRVIACNNDGVWNEYGAAMELVIDPPFWFRWWFILLCFISAVTPTYLIIKFRRDKIKSIASLKSKLAADIHDNLGADLTEITILSELVAHELKDSMPKTQAKLKDIARTARKLIDDFSDTIWIINPNRDRLYDLLTKLKSTHDELLSYLGIELNINNLEKLQDVKLNSEYRQNLYLIMKESINNSVKHSKCKRIDVDIALRGDIIRISVKDDGTGLIRKNRRSGFGLQNLRNRANLIGGKIFCGNLPEGGMIISFVGRLNNRVPFTKLLKSYLKFPFNANKHS